jgi:YD repeat-containing protein
VGGAISGPPVISVQDALGNTVPTSSAAITIAIGTNPNGGVLSGTTSKNAVSGVAGFGDLRINQSGNGYTLTASAAGLTGATSSGFNISSAGTIAGSVIRTGDGSAIGGALVEALQAGVVKGSAISGANGTYSIAGLLVGTYDVRASAGGLSTQTQTGASVTSGGVTTANFSLSDVPETSGVVYAYDELNRLRAVVNPTGEAARYEYDAVGNLLAITRYDSSQVSIVEFTPNSGVVGSTVTLYGTGYSATPSQNTVTFNGIAATVTSSTITQLVTAVPSGATTGPIGVTTPNGSATSSAAFTVASSTGAPTITGFTPTIGSAGTPVTVTGTNFETVPANNILRFNSTYAPVGSATTTNLSTTVPGFTSSGPISVTTVRGKAVSSADFFIPPSSFNVADVEYTGRIILDGPSHTATINTAGKIALVVFDGTAGQIVSLGVNATLPGCCNFLGIYDPNGVLIAQSGVSLGLDSNWHLTLPATGTYTIVIDPFSTTTGSVTLTLSSEVNAGTIVADGSSVTATINRVGQRARMTFDGTAGQIVSLGVNATLPGCCNFLGIYDPNGTLIGQSGTSLGLDSNWHLTLPATGTYTILIDPYSTTTGSVTLTLSSEVNAGTIVADGSSVTGTINRVGQRARMTFDGTAGQIVSLGVNATLPGCCNFLGIYNPDGSLLDQSGVSLTLDSNWHLTLPATGTYTILIDPYSTTTGSVTLTLSSEVNGGAVTINGSSVPITISRVGQRARLTFDGTATQQATVRLTGNSMGSVNVALFKPDGSQLTSSTSGAASFNLSTQTLPATGTYTILVDPASTNTGGINVAVTSP